MTVEYIENTLLQGDAISPQSTDLIVQRGRLTIGLAVPDGGWRIVTGNNKDSLVARVVYRYEIED